MIYPIPSPHCSQKRVPAVALLWDAWDICNYCPPASLISCILKLMQPVLQSCDVTLGMGFMSAAFLHGAGAPRCWHCHSLTAFWGNYLVDPTSAHPSPCCGLHHIQTSPACAPATMCSRPVSFSVAWWLGISLLLSVSCARLSFRLFALHWGSAALPDREKNGETFLSSCRGKISWCFFFFNEGYKLLFSISNY